MKVRFGIALLAMLVIASLAPALSGSTASAAELRNIGNFMLQVGLISEPAFEGQLNGLVLQVTTYDDMKPVMGLEKTVQVEVLHVSSKATRVFALSPVSRRPGNYAADIIFTAPGQYKLRFFGDIAGTALNETFTSGPGTFSDILPAASIRFPAPAAQAGVPSVDASGLQSLVQQAQAAAQQAQSSLQQAQSAAQQAQGSAKQAQESAKQASTPASQPAQPPVASGGSSSGSQDAFGMLGMALGGIGLVMGAVALGLVLRRK